MAESTERVDETIADPDGALEGEPTGSSGRGFPLWVFLAIAALVAAGAGGYLSYAYYGDITEVVGDVASSDSTDAAEDEGSAPRTYGQFSEIEGVIINPASSGGKRFLMMNIGLEAESIATLDEVKAKDVVVRDTVLKILGARSIEELSDITRRNELKETLRGAVNGILQEGEIKELYFTRYVLQ